MRKSDTHRNIAFTRNYAYEYQHCNHWCCFVNAMCTEMQWTAMFACNLIKSYYTQIQSSHSQIPQGRAKSIIPECRTLVDRDYTRQLLGGLH